MKDEVSRLRALIVELLNALKDASTILQQVGYIHTARKIEQLIEKAETSLKP